MVGIDRTDVFEGCVTVSVLIHYFTLAAVMWMGAEAVLMFQKLAIVFVQITTRYIVIVSLICWCKCSLTMKRSTNELILNCVFIAVVPIIPVVIPAAIDPEFMVTDTDNNEL